MVRAVELHFICKLDISISIVGTDRVDNGAIAGSLIRSTKGMDFVGCKIR